MTYNTNMSSTLLVITLPSFLFVPGKGSCMRFLQIENRRIVYFYIVALILAILLGCDVIFMVISKRSSSGDDKEEHMFIKREGWGARPAKGYVNHTTPWKIVVIRDTMRNFCLEMSTCIIETQNIQGEHLYKNFTDIAYNFLIGGDGNIYEGRGWNVTSKFSNATLDIAFHGNYQYDYPYPLIIRATDILITQGVYFKYLTEDYVIICQNQTKCDRTEEICPKVKTWKHYDNRTYDLDDF